MKIDIQKLIDAYRGEDNPSLRTYVEKVYSDVFEKKMDITGCKSCYKDATIEILVKLREQKEYILKSCYVLTINNKPHVSDMITDKMAIAYLKLHPDEIFKFSKVPQEKSPTE